MTSLPADLQPLPVFASGMMRLRTGYAGTGVVINRPSDNATFDLTYGSDNKLFDLAAFDTFRNGQICQVLQRADQMNNNTIGPTALAMCPRISNYTIGNHRCMWMESDGRLFPPFNVTGQYYGLVSSTITQLGIKANDFTVMQVVQPHTSAYCNQVQAPGLHRGTMFSMDAAGSVVARLYNDGLGDGVSYGSNYRLKAATDFDYRMRDGPVETNPTLLSCTTGIEGTFLGQNEDIRSVGARSNITTIAQQLRIGFNENSTVSTSIPNEGGGFAELLTMVWAPALTQRQASIVRSAIYDPVPIDHRRSRTNAPLILWLTDSVWAGFHGDDQRGADKRVMANLPSWVRWANYAVEGAPILPQDASIPIQFPEHYALGMFDGWIAQAIKMHKNKLHCVWGAPINDYFCTFNGHTPPTPQEAYDNATLALMARIRALAPNAAFTICTATRATGFANDGWSQSVGNLIRAGAAAHNYNVVEFQNDPVLSVCPGPCYSDGAHLTNTGFDREAVLLTPGLAQWASQFTP